MGSAGWRLFLGLWVFLAACSPSDRSETHVALPTRHLLQTFTPSFTPSLSPTPTLTPTATLTPTPTPTLTPSMTFSPTPEHRESNTIATVTPAPALDTLIFPATVAQIRQTRLTDTIARLTSFETRHTNSVRGDGFRGIDAARTYLQGELVQIAETCAAQANLYENVFDVTYQDIASTQTNFALEVVGTQPQSGVLVVGAHYDTMSRYEPTDRRFLFQPGANDNGSGVAATLELARLICLAPRQMSMVFVLFAAEEIRTEEYLGRVGSRYFVRTLRRTMGWTIQAMLNLDTIGSSIAGNSAQQVDDRASLYSAGPESSPSRQLARQIQAAAYAQMPDYQLIIEDRQDRQNRWGDHMSFTDIGLPAVRLIEGAEANERQDTDEDKANYINPSYLIKNVQAVLAFLLSRSEGPPPPSNILSNNGVVGWSAVSGAEGYLVAQRLPTQNGYTYTRLTADQTQISLQSGLIFAIGTLGENGLLGSLSPETTVR